MKAVHTSLRYSIYDAVAWSVMQGAGINYVTPFIVLGGKGLFYVAAIVGVPPLAGAVVQWLAANLTDRVGRRTPIIVSGAVGQALTWAPMCAAIFLPFDRVGYWVILAAFVASLACGNFGTPAWQSVMGDLVPSERRGRYFGLRNGISGAALTGAFFAGGAWLSLCDRTPSLGLLGLTSRNFGFLVLFAVAGVARLISSWYLSRIWEPEYLRQPADSFSLLDFIRRAPRAHFGRFVFYCAIMNAGLGLVVPFLPWYLLDQLGFGPGAFALILSVGTLANYASQPLWGHLLDRVGSKRVLAIGGVGLVLVPVLLSVSSHLVSLLIIMAYDGLVSGAFNNAVGNYLYDAVTPPKRARCAAYYNLFAAGGTLAGCLGGALLGEIVRLPLVLPGLTIVQPFSLMLVASVIVRLLANLSLLGSFAEFRLSRPRF